MKKIFTLKLIVPILVFFFVTNLVKAQEEIAWEHTFGGTLTEWSTDIIKTADGGYIMAGYTKSNNGLVTGWHDSSDVWVVKTDAAGAIQWQKALGGTGDDVAERIIQTHDLGYAIVGTTTSNDGDVSGNHGDDEVWVCKIDTIGTLQWQRCIGGTDRDYAKSLCLTPSGIAVLVYGSSSDGDFSQNFGGNNDCLLMTLDENSGNIIMKKQFGGSGDDQGYDIKYTSDNNYIIASWTNSSDSDVVGHISGYDCWVVKMDTIGNILWSNCYGGLYNDFPKNIEETHDGGFAMAGSTKSIDIGAHDTIFSDYYLVKMDASGNLLWQRAVGGSVNDGANALFERSNGSLVVGGESTSNDGYVSYNHGSNDCWIIQFDSLGSIEWEKTYGGTGSEGIMGITESTDNQIVFSGWTNSTNMDVASTYGSSDFWQVKLTNNYNLITGKLFADLNADNIQDPLENNLPFVLLNEMTTSRTSYSRFDGTYRLAILDTGNYTITPGPVNYYTPNPVNQTANFPAMNLIDSLNDFAYQPNGQFDDMRIIITAMTPVRPGRQVIYQIYYLNAGTTTQSGDIWLYKQLPLTYDSASITPSSVTTDSIQWTYTNVAPFSFGKIKVYFTADSTLVAGDTIITSAMINPVASDSMVADNYSVSQKLVVTSFDPNDITVDREVVYTNELANPPYLDYIVRFQNTGTDTAFMINVYVPVSLNLQPGTFEMLSSSANPDITYLPADHKILFHFDNIRLPDSTIDEAGSHGFIRFRLKPLSSLSAGMTIDESAAIYFDYNAPVITNTATTLIMLPTFVDGVRINSHQLIYPQPASDYVSLPEYSKFDSYEIISLTGSVMAKGKSMNKIDVRSLSSGIYILKLLSKENVVTTRLIKSN